MPHANVPHPGLQALILCGPGVSLNTFTSTPRDFPKALIPVANRPMVWYPLDWCQKMGITNVTLVSPAESAGTLEAALATHPALTSLPSPKVLSPEGLYQTSGTGELLRLPEIQKCIVSDFIVLPCDLISEIDGSRFVQQWMMLNPLSSNSPKARRKGGLAVYYPTHGIEEISHKKDETDFIATTLLPEPPVRPSAGSLRSHVQEIVMCMPTDTLNDKMAENQGFLKVRQRLLSKHGRVQLKMKHRDAHIYIFPKWVKDFVASQEKFDSISEDVLGWWAKAGWQTGLAEKLGLDQLFSEGKALDESLEGFPAEDDDDIDPALLSSTKALHISEPAVTAFASRVGASPSVTPQPVSVPPLLAYVQPVPTATDPQPLIRRVDTSHQLLAVSLYLAKQTAGHVFAHENKIHPTAQIGQQSRISQEDSLIGENVQMGIRCNVKESLIASNCEIGNNVRLTKCLLMEGVQVGDGVQLTGCIIGRRAKIEGVKRVEPNAPAESSGDAGANSKGKGKKKAADDDEDRTKLTDCEVAPNFIVEAGTEAKGEKLMAFDTEGDLDELDAEDGEDDE